MKKKVAVTLLVPCLSSTRTSFPRAHRTGSYSSLAQFTVRLHRRHNCPQETSVLLGVGVGVGRMHASSYQKERPKNTSHFDAGTLGFIVRRGLVYALLAELLQRLHLGPLRVDHPASVVLLLLLSVSSYSKCVYVRVCRWGRSALQSSKNTSTLMQVLWL
jgi:hypothetical protein